MLEAMVRAVRSTPTRRDPPCSSLQVSMTPPGVLSFRTDSSVFPVMVFRTVPGVRAASVSAMLPVMARAGCGLPMESIMTLTSHSASGPSGGPTIASLGTARAAWAGVAAIPIRTAACRRMLSRVSSCNSTPAFHVS